MDKTQKQIEEVMLKQLKNPFDPKFIKWRVGATNSDKTMGIALAYIDSREVKKRLDEVCGLSGWQDRLIPVSEGFISEIDIWVNDRWITRSNAGEYSQMSKVKGGASDAFKRAAAKLGIGHYLYYLPNVWVPIKKQGNSYVLTEVPELPDWAKPGEVENWEDVAAMAAEVNSGVDSDSITELVDNVDLLRSTQDMEEYSKVIESFTEDQKLLLANQIAIKHRELMQNARIHSDNS